MKSILTMVLVGLCLTARVGGVGASEPGHGEPSQAEARGVTLCLSLGRKKQTVEEIAETLADHNFNFVLLEYQPGAARIRRRE